MLRAQTHTSSVPILCFALLHRHPHPLNICIYNKVHAAQQQQQFCVHRERELWHYFMYTFISSRFSIISFCFTAVMQFVCHFLFPFTRCECVCPLYLCLAASYSASWVWERVCAWIGCLVLCCNSFVTPFNHCVLTMLKFISEYFVFCCNGFLSGNFITSFFFPFMQHCKL